MKYGASGGVAFDLDERSLAAARANLKAFPQVQVEAASIYDIPYEDRFDIVFSIGVVHHLDDPERAIRQLAKAAKPGGQVLVWLYGRENLGFYVNLLSPSPQGLPFLGAGFSCPAVRLSSSSHALCPAQTGVHAA